MKENEQEPQSILREWDVVVRPKQILVNVVILHRTGGVDHTMVPPFGNRVGERESIAWSSVASMNWLTQF